MRKIILASHGGLARGLADTAKMIVGNAAADVQVYGLQPGETADMFAEEVSKAVLAAPDTEFVILTDLYGASVCTAMSSLVRFSNVKLFTGMNLSMLLAVCLEYTESLSGERMEEIVKCAQAGIKCIDESCLNNESDEF